MYAISKINSIIADFRYIPKHIRYAISGTLGGVLMFLAVAVPFQYIFATMPILIFLCYWLVWFAIYENIDRVEWIMLFTIPVIWALEWYVFFYMIPVRWLTKLAFSLIFSVMFYVLVSVENIYNVGVEKNIQLQKAATTVSTVFIVGLCYIAFQIIASFETYWILSAALVALVAWIFALKHFWTIAPDLSFAPWQIKMSQFVAIAMFFTSLALSLTPFTAQTTRPVVLSGIFYLLTNAITESHDEVVFRQKTKEFLVVFIAILLIIGLTLPR